MKNTFKLAITSLFLGGVFLILGLNQPSAQGVPSPEDVKCRDYWQFDYFETRQNGVDTDYIPHCKKFTESGNGLVAGLKWIVGYNVPPGSSREFRDEARAGLREQVTRAGQTFDRDVNLDKYNFLIGMADSTEFSSDIDRALLDEMTNGRFTAENKELYSSLTKRSFEKLGCHSNGAMICLWALKNKDIKADEVTLYGPQITQGSLQLWENLIQEGLVISVKVFINKKDPIPAATLAIRTPRESPVFMREVIQLINIQAPSLRVEVFPCPYSGTDFLKCHGMKVYTANEVAMERGGL